MNEAIIDGQLTKLFSSTKEDDLTKIGKFGIGFVSVFALRPRGVLIQTGRGGEYWEILFHEDRSFSKTAIDVPVEGTQITIFIEDDRHRYNELVQDSRKTLKHWCAHSETEITFEDRSDLDSDGPEMINQPLHLDGHCLTTVSQPGTDIVLAYHSEPLYGFYNKGLTLLQTRDGTQALDALAERMKYIGVKIKSRYLEHTLSRETILKDKNYEKAIALIEEAVDGPLFDSLVGRIEELACEEKLSNSDFEEYLTLLGVLSYEPVSQLKQVQKRKLIRVFGSDAKSLEQLCDQFEKQGRLFVSGEESSLTVRLLQSGISVICGANEVTSSMRLHDHAFSPKQIGVLLVRCVELSQVGFVKGMLKQFLGTLGWGSSEASSNVSIAETVKRYVCDPNEVFFDVEIDEQPPDSAARLIEEAGKVLRMSGSPCEELWCGEIRDNRPNAPLFLTTDAFSSSVMMARSSLTAHLGRVAVVNVRHPYFQQLMQFSEVDVRLASYTLARNLETLNNNRIAPDATFNAAVGEHPPADEV